MKNDLNVYWRISFNFISDTQNTAVLKSGKAFLLDNRSLWPLLNLNASQKEREITYDHEICIWSFLKLR